MAKIIHRIMDVAVRPTRRKTPATAPVFLKKEELTEPLLPVFGPLRVGFTWTTVTVTGWPSPAVVVRKVVRAEGEDVVVCPDRSVVVMNTGDGNVLVDVGGGVKNEVDEGGGGGGGSGVLEVVSGTGVDEGVEDVVTSGVVEVVVLDDT